MVRIQVHSFNYNFVNQTLIIIQYETLDVTEGDGIYSGFLTTISNQSIKYLFRIHVVVGSQAEIDTGIVNHYPTTSSSIPLISGTRIAPFDTYNYGSSFIVKSLYNASAPDTIPPLRVTDLSMGSDSDPNKIGLIWSAPKDDFGGGDPVTNFTVLMSIGEGDFAQSCIDYEINETVTCTILVTDSMRGSTVKVQVISLDRAGNEGDPSNILYVYLAAAAPPGLSALAWGFIGLAIAILFIIIIILVVCFFFPETKDKVGQLFVVIQI